MDSTKSEAKETAKDEAKESLGTQLKERKLGIEKHPKAVNKFIKRMKKSLGK